MVAPPTAGLPWAQHTSPVAPYPANPVSELPRIAQHTVQRGNDRQRCFFNPTNCQRHLQDLRERCRQHQHPYGSDRFCAVIDAQFGRRCGPANIRRPKEQKSE